MSNQHHDTDRTCTGEQPKHLELIDQRLKNYKHADIQIHIGNTSFECHALLLQCFSEVFDELGNVPDVTLPEEKVTPEAFTLIYQWLLSTKPDVPRDHFIEVFRAAVFLRIHALLNQCWNCLGDTEALIENRAFQLYTEAISFNQTDIQNMMLKRICKFFLPLVASDIFTKLPVQDVCILLKSNYIGVFSEADVLYAASIWLLDDWNSRSQYTSEIIKLIRFPLMSRPLLSCLLGTDDNEQINGILQHDVTHNLIIQALANSKTFPSKRPASSGSNSVYIIKPASRVWLKDPKMNLPKDELTGYRPYHQECGFARFLKRLELLVQNPNSWCRWQKIESVADNVEPFSNNIDYEY
ncbi:kelch repeat and BTB domain-containing protein 2-like isoform X2 [Malaya genurostris]|uniref:kelch repeat and BTB domain-containing protein 2-like isoform X2 n=1 Tax=Malaya genurostris TaxID=325434 RepID=UPI0026F3D7EE|nr:kelch repeat and BTB domain-containing protein 2-like isoform X2 [Malaya genurostris]